MESEQTFRVALITQSHNKYYLLNSSLGNDEVIVGKSVGVSTNFLKMVKLKSGIRSIRTNFLFASAIAAQKYALSENRDSVREFGQEGRN